MRVRYQFPIFTTDSGNEIPRPPADGFKRILWLRVKVQFAALEHHVDFFMLHAIRHHRSQDIFEQQESANEQYGERNSQKIEVFIDEVLNGFAKPENQTGNDQEPGSSADDGCDEKHGESHIIGTSGQRKYFVRDGSKTGCKNDPEIIAVIPVLYQIKPFNRESGNIIVEEMGKS